MKNTIARQTCLAVATLALSAPLMAAPSKEDTPEKAIAVLQGTQGNTDAKATIYFNQTPEGVAYTAVAHGLKPGAHGYHLHIYGDCASPDAKSAGTHFNLQGSSLNPPKDIDRITGNLGELVADVNGDARDKGLLKHAQLNGDKSIIGRAAIIHAEPNDQSQPPIGAAGARQACGVIGIRDPKAPMTKEEKQANKAAKKQKSASPDSQKSDTQATGNSQSNTASGQTE